MGPTVVIELSEIRGSTLSSSYSLNLLCCFGSFNRRKPYTIVLAKRGWFLVSTNLLDMKNETLSLSHKVKEITGELAFLE